jgi:hypothetical protein
MVMGIKILIIDTHGKWIVLTPLLNFAGDNYGCKSVISTSILCCIGIPKVSLKNDCGLPIRTVCPSELAAQSNLK